jgi:hypothetical protein
MKPPENFERIVNRKRYSTKTATLLAGDDYWDGSNFERQGRNRFLYRTPKGNFFLVSLTAWQGEQNTLEPITEGEAIELYEEILTERTASYEDAFPGVEVEDA